MPDREKVIKGLKCYIGGFSGEENCKQCQYRPHIDDCKSGAIMDAIALLKEYDDALKLMVYQYCTMKPLTVHDEVFHNKFMSAGEAAFRLLGLENGQSTNGVWERWFPNG